MGIKSFGREMLVENPQVGLKWTPPHIHGTVPSAHVVHEPEPAAVPPVTSSATLSRTEPSVSTTPVVADERPVPTSVPPLGFVSNQVAPELRRRLEADQEVHLFWPVGTWGCVSPPPWKRNST